ncbi:MAG: hypothetical protein ABIF82_09260 [Planctomycetota bacterium]
MHRSCIVAFIALAVVSCTKEDDPRYSDPRELSDTFVNALLKDPKQAFALMEEGYRSKTNAGEFASFVKEALLPGCGPTARVEFVKLEEGFLESDGLRSSEYHYRLVPPDGGAAVTVEVHVVRHDALHYVRRVAVPKP